MEISEEDMQNHRRNVNALLIEIKELGDEIAELKPHAYRYKFIRSTYATTAEQITGYDKSVDDHIMRRNKKFN